MTSSDMERQALNGEEPVESLSCGQFCKNIAQGARDKTGKDWALTGLRIVGVCTTIYFFLFSLDLMGAAFKVLGSCEAGGMFNEITNPIAGLMIGILATVLVQSSSTSTSIVVSLVGAGSMDVQTAIPVIMGANIGTSVTNTIVSMGQATNSDQFEKAFAGATVHDMFNFLSVLVLLPIEQATHMLYWLTYAMTPTEVAKGDKWEGPIKKIVAPLVDLFITCDKKVAENIAKGKTTCDAIYDKIPLGTGACGDSPATGLMKCDCNDDGSVGDCPAFFKEYATQADEVAAGSVALIISLILLTFCLACLVKLLQSMVLGTSSNMLRKATNVNGYFAILIGMGITILVQSSSITTSVLTPLVGVGVIPLEGMLPLTLGANIGTCFTAILASLVSSKPESVQIALCHLFFNLIGIVIWYPVPFMRRVPLNAARGLGAMTRRYKTFPLVYIALAFVFAPLALLGVSSLYESGAAFRVLGVMLTIALSIGLIYFLFWWNRRNGKASVFAMLDRRQEHSDAIKTLPTTLKSLQSQLDQLNKANNIVPKLAADMPKKSISPNHSQIHPAAEP